MSISDQITENELDDYKQFKEIFPDSTLSFDQWKTEQRTVQITHQEAQYLMDMLFDVSIAANKCPYFAEKVRKLLDWSVKQGLQTEADKEACLLEFNADI